MSNHTARTMLTGFAASLALSIVACTSGTPNDGSNGGGETDLESFSSEYCALLRPCCAAANLPTTMTGCRALISLSGQQGSYDANAAASCLAANRQAASSSSTFCADLGGTSVNAVCKAVFAGKGGTRAPGEACESSRECAEPADGLGEASCAVAFVDSRTERRCQVEIPGAVGTGPCSSTGAPTTIYDCEGTRNLRCESTTNTCVALGNPGDACVRAEDCAKPNYCNGGKCAAPVALGGDCTGQECGSAGYCDANRKCVASVPPGGPCEGGNVCGRGSFCISGKCAAEGASSQLAIALFCSSSE